MIKPNAFYAHMKRLPAVAAIGFLFCCSDEPKENGNVNTAKDSTLTYLKKQAVFSFSKDSSHPVLFLENYSIFPYDYRPGTITSMWSTDTSAHLNVEVPLGRLYIIHQPGIKKLWVIPGTRVELFSRISNSYSMDTLTIENGHVFVEQIDSNSTLNVDANGIKVALKGHCSIDIRNYQDKDSARLVCTKGSGTTVIGGHELSFKAPDRLCWHKSVKTIIRDKIDIFEFSDWPNGFIKESNLYDFMDIIGKLYNKRIGYVAVNPFAVEGVFSNPYTHTTLQQLFKALNAGFGLDCTLKGDSIIIKRHQD